MLLSECVCQLSRWSLILTTGKSQSHNALGAAPNEEAAAAAMSNQSQLEYWRKKKVAFPHSLSLSLSPSLLPVAVPPGPAIVVLSVNMNWVYSMS